MKKYGTLIFVFVAFLSCGITFEAGMYFGGWRYTSRGIHLGTSSPVRREVCATLGARVFVIADAVLAGRASGKQTTELNHLMPNESWTYEPTDEEFIIRWKLSYDDEFRYESRFDLVEGTNDFQGTYRRNKNEPNKAVAPTTMRVTDPAYAGSAPRTVAAHFSQTRNENSPR